MNEKICIIKEVTALNMRIDFFLIQNNSKQKNVLCVKHTILIQNPPNNTAKWVLRFLENLNNALKITHTESQNLNLRFQSKAHDLLSNSNVIY